MRIFTFLSPWLLAGGFCSVDGASTNAELRVIRMRANQIKTPTATWPTVAHIAATHLNRVFLLAGRHVDHGAFPALP
jgi:hypothetical protein